MGTGGLVVAAPASGSGKTVVTLGLIRALKNAGRRVGSLKIGPDYIDAGFHHIASGEVCRNYDPWGMLKLTLDAQVSALSEISELIVATKRRAERTSRRSISPGPVTFTW